MRAFALILMFEQGGGLLEVDACVFAGEKLVEGERGTVRDDGFWVMGAYGFAFAQLQTLAENADKRGVEREWPAFKDDGRNDVESLRKAAQRLLGDGVESGKRQIGLGCALVEQRLDVGFGVHAAATRDLVDGGPLCGERIEFLDGNLQKRRDLIDKSACAASTASVHAHVGHARFSGSVVFVEKDHLGILTAQLYRAARLRMHSAHGDGIGNDFLDIGNIQHAGDGLASRSAHCKACRDAGEAGCDVFERMADAFCLPRVVSFVAGKKDSARTGIDDAGFRGGGSHINADMQNMQVGLS